MGKTKTTRSKESFILGPSKPLGQTQLPTLRDVLAHELPLRHHLEEVDGGTSGKGTFKEKFGTILPTADYLAWNPSFKAISEGEEICISDEVASDLSSDQKYMFLAVKSIRQGTVSDQLKILTPGPIFHAR